MGRNGGLVMIGWHEDRRGLKLEPPRRRKVVPELGRTLSAAPQALGAEPEAGRRYLHLCERTDEVGAGYRQDTILFIVPCLPKSQPDSQRPEPLAWAGWRGPEDAIPASAMEAPAPFLTEEDLTEVKKDVSSSAGLGAAGRAGAEESGNPEPSDREL